VIVHDGWNLADIWESHAERFPDALAQVQGERRFSWAEFDRRADAVAAELVERGARYQDKVVQYLYNCPEYLESMHALFKAGLVPVNTNYRYTDDELVYLWDNADAVACVFDEAFTERVERVRDRVPRVRTWLRVGGQDGCPDWARPYGVVAASGRGRFTPPWRRSGDDLYLLYTGGTTGMPKGVMWRQDDIVMSLDLSSRHPLAAEPSPEALAARVTKPGPVGLPAAPLMHGTGAFNSVNVLFLAGSVVTLEGRHFDPGELLDAVDHHRVNSLSIVGDAFAKPILAALDAQPQRWDVSSLKVVVSSGVMWSERTKQGLLAHNPRMLLIDSLGSSEAIGMAQSVSSGVNASTTARFTLNANTRVITEEGRDVVPGSGERGRLAVKGRTPLGYYKDPEKSAATFVVIDGARYSVPGDWAEVAADGTVLLLGRGSVCINTGGEKVYPEEVEEALKTHPSVADAVVVGVPDERFGEAICAVVEPRHGVALDEAELVAHVRSHLAAYKAPRHVVSISSVGRAANGKVDYRFMKAHAVQAIAPVQKETP